MKVEHENLIRSLKDEPMVVSSIFCRLGWHKWTKWREPTKIISAVYHHQVRHCVHCNILDIRKVKE